MPTQSSPSANLKARVRAVFDQPDPEHAFMRAKGGETTYAPKAFVSEVMSSLDSPITIRPVSDITTSLAACQDRLEAWLLETGKSQDLPIVEPTRRKRPPCLRSELELVGRFRENNHVKTVAALFPTLHEDLQEVCCLMEARPGIGRSQRADTVAQMQSLISVPEGHGKKAQFVVWFICGCEFKTPFTLPEEYVDQFYALLDAMDTRLRVSVTEDGSLLCHNRATGSEIGGAAILTVVYQLLESVCYTLVNELDFADQLPPTRIYSVLSNGGSHIPLIFDRPRATVFVDRPQGRRFATAQETENLPSVVIKSTGGAPFGGVNFPEAQQAPARPTRRSTRPAEREGKSLMSIFCSFIFNAIHDHPWRGEEDSEDSDEDGDDDDNDDDGDCLMAEE